MVGSNGASRRADPILVTLRDSAKPGSNLLTCGFRLVNAIVTTPLRQRHTTIDLRLIAFVNDRGNEKIPAYKRECGCVAQIHRQLVKQTAARPTNGRRDDTPSLCLGVRKAHAHKGCRVSALS